ncbi:MAG: hypothetical protein PHT07_02695 [Paludibacter sp.]|nr:hypothetical protein [Paludibacter sp.]
MKIIHKTKRVYSSPEIEHVKLDNDISLILESDPPNGPNETNNTPEYFKNDPFKSILA